MQHFKLLVIATSVIILLFGFAGAEIKLTSNGTTITLNCDPKVNVTIKRSLEKVPRETASHSLTISKTSNTNGDEYSCTDSTDSRAFIFIKLCRNCVDVDAGTVAGIVIGDIVATILIAVAVYSISTPARVKQHQASDRQALVPNDATSKIYSGIKQSDRQEYSELEPRRKK
ncbi:T-cell surface glycoprotein CD3 gamma chain-like isoform X2 [Heptranchias perlo]|uniref:T-cell surface glycoprotein CD3 gamma chain-like isoform X2 n=1 Tax=Heptranchias perlo TaxID=212740 RepID=UPI003559B8A2